MLYLTSVTTGEMFFARAASGDAYEISGPMSYREIADARRAERVGERYDFAGELIDGLGGLVHMSERALQRCEDEASVQGVKVGDGWLS